MSDVSRMRSLLIAFLTPSAFSLLTVAGEAGHSL